MKVLITTRLNKEPVPLTRGERFRHWRFRKANWFAYYWRRFLIIFK